MPSVERLGNGFVYVATGARFVEEAECSCRSLKDRMPDASVTVFTDRPDLLSDGVFDNFRIVPDPCHNFFDKIYAFVNTPYSKTVFIDTDTFICDGVGELFQLLDRFDVAAVRDHWASDGIESPLGFDDLNTGVVAFADNETVKEAFNDWSRIYRHQIETGSHVEHDQPAFAKAMYNSVDLKLYILPKNYNIRTIAPVVLGYGFMPKIIHGRISNHQYVRAKLSENGFSVMIPNGTHVMATSFSGVDKTSTAAFVFMVGLSKVATNAMSRVKSVIRKS